MQAGDASPKPKTHSKVLDSDHGIYRDPNNLIELVGATFVGLLLGALAIICTGLVVGVLIQVAPVIKNDGSD